MTGGVMIFISCKFFGHQIVFHLLRNCFLEKATKFRFEALPHDVFSSLDDFC